MAQRKQLTWTELRVGLFVLVALFVIEVGIFYVTGAGFLGPKYRLRTYLPEVAGVTNGAPVRLDGVDIGNVESIKMVPRTPGHIPEKSRNIELMLRLDKRFQPDILTDSTASLVTEGLLGNRYVNITRGFTGVPLKENQEVYRRFARDGGGELIEVKESTDLAENLLVAAFGPQWRKEVGKLSSGF